MARGYVPLGYDVEDRKLVVNEREAATVRRIFEKFTKMGSVTELDRLSIERVDLFQIPLKAGNGRPAYICVLASSHYPPLRHDASPTLHTT